MRCPKCGRALLKEASCHSCPECGGTWFSMRQAQEFFDFEVRELKADVDGLIGKISPSGIPCPDCSGQLVQLEVQKDLVLEQCFQCNGLFFEAGECLSLKSKIGLSIYGPTFVRVLESIICGRHGPYR